MREDEVVHPLPIEVGPGRVRVFGDVAEDPKEGAIGVDAGVVGFSAGDGSGVGEVFARPLANAEIVVPVGCEPGELVAT